MEMIPVVGAANAAMDSGKSVDIQLFHETMGHSNEEYLKLTAKSRGIELKGELQPCESCHVTKARKKDVAKTSESRSNTPGQRLLVDQSSVKAPSFGGRNYWLCRWLWIRAALVLGPTS